MERNELRLGNWMLTSGGYMQITGIAWNTCWFDDLDYYHTEIKGIPLTPEILLKAGFEAYGLWFVKGDLYIAIGGNISIEKWVTPYRTPEYLHQLQNLYYALTSHELTINL